MSTQDQATDQHSLPPGTWQLDPSTTTVTVSVKKLLLWTIPATLAITDGTVEVDDSGSVVNVQVVADASSYRSKNDKRNEHIVGADFLDAANHPTITLSTGAINAGSGAYDTEATVTVKGQTAPMVVRISDVQTSPTSATFRASATVDRRTLGIEKLPSFVIGDDLQLSVSATATRAA